MIKYYIERNGMYYNNYVNFGIVCENESGGEYTYLKLYHVNQDKNLQDLKFDITDISDIQKNIDNNILIEGHLVQEQYDSYYSTNPIRVDTNDTYYNYFDALDAIKKNNKRIKHENDKILNMSEYDYSVYLTNRDLFHYHNKHLNKLVWDYIDSVEMSAFEIECRNGIIKLKDMSKHCIPYYDESTDKTKDICGIIDITKDENEWEHEYKVIDLELAYKIRDKYDELRKLKNNKKNYNRRKEIMEEIDKLKNKNHKNETNNY